MKGEAKQVDTDKGVRFGAVEIFWGRRNGPMAPANSIILHGERPVLVDPGAAPEAEAEAVRDKRASILLTHYHGDHREGTGRFPDLPVLAHRADVPAIEDRQTWYEWTLGPEETEALEAFKSLMAQFCPEERRVSRYLAEGDVVGAGAARLRVVHLPGHTPGHLGLYFEEPDLLFTTDMDLSPVGPWYGNRAASLPDTEATLKRLAGFDAARFVPGHGARVFNREEFREKLAAFASKIGRIDDAVLSRLAASPAGVEEIAALLAIAFPVMPEALKKAFSRNLARKHLERFLENGEIALEEGLYRRR